MSHLPYETFRETLAIRYPNCGHALWEPSPGGLYEVVEVGDVGFIHEGCFHRLFNVCSLEIIHPIKTSVFRNPTNNCASMYQIIFTRV